MRTLHWLGIPLLLAGISIASTDAPPAHNTHAPAAASTAEVSADDALKMLIDGNERYVAGKMDSPRTDAARRCETFTGGQHPIASVLSCADSRAPVELLFDQGIGDLFTIRVAGNVADTDEIGTIEYGAGHLHTPLIIVLGHTKCGAVTAVVQEAKVSPNIAKLVDNIVPAVEQARKIVPMSRGDTLVQAAIDANVFQSIQDMFANSEEIRELVAHGKVKVVGAVYDIHIGSVRWLGEHPRQAALLNSPDSKPSHGEELVHPTAPAKPAAAKPTAAHASPAHETPSHDAPSHGDKSAHPSAAESHGSDAKHSTADADHGPTSSAEKPKMPHETPGWKGMIMPAAFLGGAGLVSGTIFHFMKSRSHPVEVKAEEPTA